MFQIRKEEVRRVHTALTNEVQLLSSKEAHFVEVTCCIPGIEYRDKVKVESNRR
jgi:hypothetical protein